MRAWTCHSWRSRYRLRSSRSTPICQNRPFSSPSPQQSRAKHVSAPCRRTHEEQNGRHASTRSTSGSVSHGSAATLRPLPTEFNKVEAWISLIEPYLPDHVRQSQVPSSGEEQPLSVVAKVIANARQIANIDVIAFLCVEQKRWDAVHWICKSLIDEAGSPQPVLSQQSTELMSNLPWPIDGAGLCPISLDIMTEDIRNMELNLQDVQNSPIASIEKTNDDLLTSLMSESSSKAIAMLGDIWITLGNLILAATSHETHTGAEIMPNVLRIIANLHHNGWIPEAVYHDSHNTDPSALQQPPLLSELSSLMISALTEAAYSGEGGVAGTSPSKNFLKSRIFSRTPDKIPNLGPEIWLEFCLWCCVHGGWVHQGSSILDQMRKLQGQHKWSLIYWRDILESPEEKWAEFTQRRLKSEYGRSIETPSRRDLVQRTISAEVVIAVIDGLVADMSSSDSDMPSNPRLAGRILQLKRILDDDHMSLGVSSWDSVIARIADASYIDIEARPTVMESVLTLTEIYGQEIHSLNAPKSGKDTDPVASYVFDASAAVIGLYHRTLHAHIKGRDVAKALRILSKLQNLTDVNKMRSMEEFFRELQETPVKIAEESADSLVKQQESRKIFSFRHNVYSKFPGVQYPGYFPAVPITILAELLDLLVDAGNHEIARWMLFSQDIDGPLIPESMYSDQLIAPALIKYAASLPDSALLLKITEAQSTDISGPTLVALCQSRMRQRNFTGAIEVLNLIREYSIHEWKPEESAVLIQLLLQLLHESPGASSWEPVQLLQQMLNGKFGKQWGERPSQLDTVVGLLSDFSPDVRRICAGMLNSGNYYRMDMSTKTFNILLDGAIRTLGVGVGRRLVQDWCLNASNLREIAIVEDSQASQTKRASPAEKFLGTGQQEYEAGTAVFEGTLQHDVDTIRTIIAGVLRENAVADSKSTTTSSEDNLAFDLQPAPDSAQSVDISSSAEADTTEDEINFDTDDSTITFTHQHSIMEWAVNILRQDFNLPNTEIDYLTRGYLTSQHLDLYQTLSHHQAYSPETLRMWRTLQTTRRLWARTQEGRLRTFATNHHDRQLVVANVPSVERYFLQCLAGDFGLTTVEYGEDEEAERDVKFMKGVREARVPARRIGEVLRMQARLDG